MTEMGSADISPDKKHIGLVATVQTKRVQFHLRTSDRPVMILQRSIQFGIVGRCRTWSSFPQEHRCEMSSLGDC